MTEKEMIAEMAGDMIYGCVKHDLWPDDAKEIAKALVILGYRKIPEGSVVLTKEEYEKLQENILELKNLEWYKFWHKKHKKEIEDLTTELETYRPTKLSGHGQCKCSKCGSVCWTDWFSRYKGQTLCDSCLKELIEKDNNDYRKETAKEFADIVYKALTDERVWKAKHNWWLQNGECFELKDLLKQILKQQYGVEVE